MIEKLFEKRTGNTSGLDNPTGWLLRGLGAVPTTAGLPMTELNAMSIASVFACVRNLAEDVAKLPTITYRKLDNNGKERAVDEPIFDLLRFSPNPEMTAYEFEEAVTAGAVLWGNGYAEIERDKAGRPIALWPIDPVRVIPKRTLDDKRQLYYQIMQVYGVHEVPVVILPKDMIHIKGFSLNGIVGCMMVKIGAESMALTLAAERFGAAYFGNGAKPGGIFIKDGVLNDVAYDRLKKSLEDEGGVYNSHKAKILEDGLKWEKQTYNPNESQFIETRQFQLEEVARWFRMPPHKIQHLIRSTNNNIEQQSIEYLSDTLLPWLVKWEQEFKCKLLSNKKDLFVEHLVDSVLRGEALTRARSLAIQAQYGAITPDEWRGFENRNPIADGLGGQHMMMRNMTTLEDMAKNPGGQVNNVAKNAKRCLLESHKILLADTIRGILKIEADRVPRIIKKNGDLRMFYAEGETEFRAKIGPVFDAFAAAFYGMETGKRLEPEQTRQLVIFAAGCAAKHVAISMADLGDKARIDEKISAWDGRCEMFADGEIEQLASLVETFKKRGNKNAA